MKPKAIYQLKEPGLLKIYGPNERAEIASLVEDAPLAEAEVAFAGWGAPKMDAAYLVNAPNLKLVLYGAGSVKGVVTDAFWERGVRICSAWVANGVPVAEYTVATITLSLKRFWLQAANVRAKRNYSGKVAVPGAFGSTVGLVLARRDWADGPGAPADAGCECHVTQAERDEILDGVAAALGKADADVRTHYDTSTSIFTRQAQVMDTEADTAFLYAGPVDARLRPFCEAHVGKLYTRDRIDALHNGQLPNVLLTGGGYNCRHVWQPLSPVSDLLTYANTGERVPRFARALRQVPRVMRHGKVAA